MSTHDDPYGGTPPSDGSPGAVDLANPHEHHWFKEPTKEVGPKFVGGLVFAQLIFFIALLGPAIIGIGLKVQSVVPLAEQTTAVGIIAGFGALFAVIGNVLFGRLSDRTTSRFGRRRPWLVAGTVVMTIAFVVMALGQSVPVITAGWCLAQLGANATLAPFIATISDQVPKFQRGSVSALLGIAQNVGILGGTYLAQLFQDHLVILFVVPSLFAIGAMLLFAVILPDQRLTVHPPKMTAGEWVTTFWLNPRKHPDFALAWWSRFLITLATFMFTTFRLFYLRDELGLAESDAPAAVTVGVLIYTIALVASGWIAGKISDRTGRRKFLVAGSTLLFAVGIVMLAHVDSVTGFYVVEAVLGVAYGIYVGVDLALVVDVLPNPDDAGKDLGVFNMANALPQTVAPVIGAALLAVGVSGVDKNYELLLYTAGVAGLIGAVVVLFIKKVK
ncbi:Major Facilitator Superfamily protein [Friedmanniella luteola]|uniref:Major Facilitator Superfamily protein n=1 Tax=Friedmanniella luteola TaxID=546871 RepID=A0A1H1LBQ1_9ACTN|nr:MFS transporter [Friedmanniella luteola]SDR71752.1 Major Facilitator Superfamily protein [Friedmanniella luteola]